MGRLEDLQAQKKLIEAEIRKLKTEEIKTDRCKFHLQHFASRDDDWVVSYKNRFVADPRREHYRSIITCSDRNQAIDLIQNVIDDLTELQEVLKGEKNND